MNRRKAILWAIIIAIIFMIIGFVIHSLIDKKPLTENSVQNSKDFPLLAKRLFVENPNDTRINFSPLRSALKNYFKDNNLNGSLYFEYLPTGTSIRVNGDQQFRGASLIKLPVAMELFKAQELGRVSLDKKIQLKQEWLNNGYGTLYEKGVGYELTLKEAAEIMLKESDNTALRAVADTTQTALKNSERALGSLDVDFTETNDEGINISARSYSSFLKCLYFACYDSKEDSQKILSLLTETDFNDRLAAGVDDKSIKIAHKIGVFNTQVQSDCGIVYYPNNNYLLCIMLTGNDDNATNSRIADISKMVYAYIKTPLN